MPGPGAACGGRRSQAGTQATAAAPRSRRSSRRRTRGRWPASSDAPSSARRHRHRCKICKFSRVAGPKTRGSLDAPTTARRHRHRLLARAGEQSAATWWGGQRGWLRDGHRTARMPQTCLPLASASRGNCTSCPARCLSFLRLPSPFSTAAGATGRGRGGMRKLATSPARPATLDWQIRISGMGGWVERRRALRQHTGPRLQGIPSEARKSRRRTSPNRRGPPRLQHQRRNTAPSRSDFHSLGEQAQH